ncbi:hypothetical protein GCM10008942_20040 [Rhizomicrobium electricum]|uniref:Uncharacterized protein n=1 Tax=Rhizomicrobium electricum TaxID=480070 RepID=A0ABN1EPR5_9PROT
MPKYAATPSVAGTVSQPMIRTMDGLIRMTDTESLLIRAVKRFLVNGAVRALSDVPRASSQPVL